MTATLVDDKLTPLTIEQLAIVLHDASAVVMGASVPAECLAVLVAQACLETWNGQRVHCWNFGNAKRSPSWSGLYCRFKCDEIFSPATANMAKLMGPCDVHDWANGMKRVVLYPPHPWSEFRAFLTAVEGATEWLRLIVTHFTAAWNRAYHGDAAGYVTAAHATGYFTGDLAAYTRAVVSIAHKVRGVCEKVCGNDGEDLTDMERDEIMGLVALTLDGRDSPVGALT